MLTLIKKKTKDRKYGLDSACNLPACQAFQWTQWISLQNRYGVIGGWKSLVAA